MTLKCCIFSFHLPFTNIWHMQFKVPSYDFICNVYLPFNIFSNQNFLQKWWDIHGVLFVYLLFFSFFFFSFFGGNNLYSPFITIFLSSLVCCLGVFRASVHRKVPCTDWEWCFKCRSWSVFWLWSNVNHYSLFITVFSLWVISSNYSIFTVAKQTFL